MEKNLAIVIVNYNGVNDTLKCIESIRKNCEVSNEIIVVDNKSDEFNRKLLIENNKYYKLIFNDNNEGFARANNIGIKYALNKGYETILLINNDTLIEKNSLDIMYKKIKYNIDIGIVGCTILYNDNRDKIWFDGGEINWIKFLGEHDNMKKKYNCNVESRYVSFLSGCCMMIKREIFEKVGLLPEEYFMYFEDVDFCAKVLQNKYKLYVCRDAIIYHKVSAASGGEDSPFTIEWCNRNRIIFMKKYKCNSESKLEFFYSVIYFILGRMIRFLQFVLNGDWTRAKALFKGCINGLKFREGDSKV
ncbi:glycosyltransferase family 2 protein [Clostridium perfringens]|uniref:glycosyltransferase family 2 protein n=1 Tax=Clostridium perfringens TaxID=1502 RepID=UPI0024BBFE84|nr:glycosyltransferase family 2 protein [Clostridium perfringens]